MIYSCLNGVGVTKFPSQTSVYVQEIGPTLSKICYRHRIAQICLIILIDCLKLGIVSHVFKVNIIDRTSVLCDKPQDTSRVASISI